MSFLTASEVTLIKKDWDTALAGPESNDITLEYYEYDSTDPSDVDEVYGTEDRDRLATPVTHPIRAMQVIVDPRELQVIGSEILEIGDSIFYIHRDVDLTEPKSGQPAIPGSLIFIDPGSVRWEPVLQDLENFERNLCVRIGNQRICQAIPCKLERS